MEPKFVTQEDFKTFLDTFKKEMDVLKDTINEIEVVIVQRIILKKIIIKI